MTAKNNKYDLTQGPILQKLVALSLPIMATSFMQMAYSLSDTFWMGILSRDYDASGAVAAVGTAALYIWLSMGLMSLGRMGAEIGVSQNMGRGDAESAKKYAQNALVISLILGTLYGVVMVIARRPLIGFFNIDDPQVVLQAQQYLAVSAIAMPFIFAHNVITGCFNGFGNTKLPFYINSLGLGLNIAISPVLIFVFELGIAGAAIGTVIATLVNFALKLWAIKRYSSRPFEVFQFRFKIDKEKIIQICKWGVPVAVESMTFTFLFMVVSRLISDFGIEAIAAHRVGYQVEALSFMVGGGFAMAFGSYVGQNFGAKKWSRLFSGYRMSTVVMAVYGIVITFILFVFARPLVSIFLNSAIEIDMGVDYLRIIALTQLLFCMEGVAVGSFRGRGLTIKPTIVSAGSNVLRVIVTYALAATALGITGVWIGIAVAMTVKSVWLLVWHWHCARKWPRIEAIDGNIA
ncbi:MAG: MATE family efflux transporter [Defluviitaleaceae bacterium]|nr:MATE family efflux transporter [Defluviitaleaceae bacterium]